MIPKECYEEYGSDLDSCSTQQNEGCGRCRLAKEPPMTYKTIMTYKTLAENPKDGTYRVKAFERYVYIEGNKIIHIPPNCSIKDDEELEKISEGSNNGINL